jgi:hypothetical protein
MLWRAVAVVSVVALAGCAATTPPPRFSAVSPADPAAPESVTSPPPPALTGAPDAPASPTPTPTPSPHRHHHGGHP